MELLKIVIVDDEEEVRESILSNMNWEGIGYEVVGAAENGEEALEIMEQRVPDMVLTDIRMPYMDGLELSERIKKQYPYIRVVLLTGFDEFEYAKQAISLNVMEYILKPINVEELSEILIRLRDRILEDLREKRDILILKEKYSQSIPLIQERVLKKLLEGNLGQDERDVLETLEQNQIKLSKGKMWLAATLSIEPLFPQKEFYENQEFYFMAFSKELKQMLEHKYSFEEVRTSLGITVILALENENRQELIESLEIIISNARAVFQMLVTIGVGKIYDSIQKIKDSYNESKNALGYFQMVGKGSVIPIDDVETVERKEVVLEEGWENQFISVIKFGTPQKVEACLNKILEHIAQSRLHYLQQQIYYIRILNKLFDLIQKNGVDPYAVIMYGNDLSDIMNRFQQEEGARQELLRISLSVHNEIYKEREDTTKKIIERAKEFIDQNYQNPELSGEMVCEYLHISSTYFSTIFKKEMKESYVSYLTNLRLSKAAKLLTQTQEKAYLIGQKVGYTEPNYFSYVFKKKYGVAPSRFRDDKERS